LTATWALEHLQDGPALSSRSEIVPSTGPRIIEGDAAKQLSAHEKWELLSPFLKRFGASSLAYATLQQGMEYFIDETGYIAYTTVQHPVFSPKPRRITLCEPICSQKDLPKLLDKFFKDNPRVTFAVVSEEFANLGRSLGFKANCIGYEPELPIQTYNTQGNWKELDLVKRARNEAKREGLVIREEPPEKLDTAQLAAISKKWISNKKINDREIWLYARRPVFGFEEDVRKFVAYDGQGNAAGFVFYDPMYRDGQVCGYSANIVRCDEKRYGRLATAIHMAAIEKFKEEGKETLNLLLAPFVKLDEGKFNDDLTAKWFFQLSARFGNDIYNFKGLSFHKSKYRGVERPLYCLSNSLIMSNDLFLAFMSADIARSYFSTMGQLLRGMLPAKRKAESA